MNGSGTRGNGKLSLPHVFAFVFVFLLLFFCSIRSKVKYVLSLLTVHVALVTSMQYSIYLLMAE